MNRRRTCKELLETFIRLANKFNALDKYPIKFNNEHELYHSEKHMLDVFGDNPEKNITELARLLGVTKGAISQIASKLEKKGAIRRYKEASNEKEVFIKLTSGGRDFYNHHKARNDETIDDVQEMLKEFPGSTVESFLQMLKAFEGYMDSSIKQMEERAKKIGS